MMVPFFPGAGEGVEKMFGGDRRDFGGDRELGYNLDRPVSVSAKHEEIFLCPEPPDPRPRSPLRRRVRAAARVRRKPRARAFSPAKN